MWPMTLTGSWASEWLMRASNRLFAQAAHAGALPEIAASERLVPTVARDALPAGLRAMVFVGLFGVLVVAVLAAAAPAQLSASSFVWAEPLVSLCFVLTTVVLLWWFDTSRLLVGMLAIGVAVANGPEDDNAVLLPAESLQPVGFGDGRFQRP